MTTPTEVFITTKELMKKEILPIFNSAKFQEDISYLKDRWQDEKQYEDFKNYEDRIKAYFKNVQFDSIKVSKHFTVTMVKNNVKFEIKCSARFLSWSLKRI